MPAPTSRFRTTPQRRRDTGPPDWRHQVDQLRDWFFTWPGLIAGLALFLIVATPAGLLGLFVLREDRAQLAISGGLWWVFGVVLVHQAVPAARPEREYREPIAAAAWHAGLVLLFTVPVVWLVMFRGGVPAYTLADVLLVAGYLGLFTVIFGIAMIWLRGHSVEQTIRYTAVSLAVAVAWGVLWIILDGWLFRTA